ncbi:hypothetical protein ACXDF8_24010 [Mycolicibacterium sp. CBM1]
MSEHDRARELVDEVNATWRRDDFDIASPLADDARTDVTHILASNVEDVRLAVERFNQLFNLGAGVDGHLTGHGFSAALTGDFDDRIRNLSGIVLSRHRATSSEKLWVVDHQTADDGLSLLPLWDRDNPLQSNVIRGLVATHPAMVHVLRGGYTADALARAIWLGIIPTVCNLAVAPNCDFEARPPRDCRDGRKVWGLFTTQRGEYLTFHTVCEPCFFTFWPMSRLGKSANYRSG